jgi:hypothetical protein
MERLQGLLTGSPAVGSHRGATRRRSLRPSEAGSGRGLAYSAGSTITDDVHDAIAKILAKAWTPVCEASAAADVDALSEVSGLMLQAHARYAERYRTLLVVRLREHRTASAPNA